MNSISVAKFESDIILKFKTFIAKLLPRKKLVYNQLVYISYELRNLQIAKLP